MSLLKPQIRRSRLSLTLLATACATSLIVGCGTAYRSSIESKPAEESTDRAVETPTAPTPQQLEVDSAGDRIVPRQKISQPAAIQTPNANPAGGPRQEQQALQPVPATHTPGEPFTFPEPEAPHPANPAQTPEFNREEYNPIYENPFLAVAQKPLSTFSIDVDTASYANTRRFLNENRLPPADAVRLEGIFVNWVVLFSVELLGLSGVGWVGRFWFGKGKWLAGCMSG
ncbi:MAG: von Willebrand factor type A domain-containing protein, partial [Cyanobacteria bacterium J06641_5]